MSASDMIEIDGVVTGIPGHGFYKVTAGGARVPGDAVRENEAASYLRPA